MCKTVIWRQELTENNKTGLVVNLKIKNFIFLNYFTFL